MNRRINYIIALTNLYGIVPAEKVVEIYNSQNEEQTTLEEVRVLFVSKRQRINGYKY